MIDPNLLRNDIDAVATSLAQKNYTLDKKVFLEFESKRKTQQVETQALQQARNSKSKMIGQMKANGEDTTLLFEEVGKIVDDLKIAEKSFDQIGIDLTQIQMRMPNIPHKSVPVGKTEADNVEIRRWGEKKEFDFNLKEHDELGEKLGLIDFKAAAKISGARFVVLKGKIAQLQRALIQFMLDIHITEHGYQEVYVPYIVNSTSLRGTGQLPKFADDQYKVDNEGEAYLIPTSEVPVTNLVRDTILAEKELPTKYVCHTPCFRRESGSYGKDTRGMFRQHQFEKVELIQFSKPENSYAALEALTQDAERVLQKLNLHYRVVSLCTGDLGFTAAKTYDLEVWLPGQQRYREISSCSNTEAFQARRLKSRWRNPETGKPELIHTLNGSGLAAGRTLIAVIENYQDKQGRIHVPEVLRPYMNGVDIIE